MSHFTLHIGNHGKRTQLPLHKYWHVRQVGVTPLCSSLSRASGPLSANRLDSRGATPTRGPPIGGAILPPYIAVCLACSAAPGQSRLDFSIEAGWGEELALPVYRGSFFIIPLISAHFRSFPPLFCHSGNSELAAGSKQARRDVRRVLFASRYIHRTYVIEMTRAWQGTNHSKMRFQARRRDCPECGPRSSLSGAGKPDPQGVRRIVGSRRLNPQGSHYASYRKWGSCN